MVYFCTTNTVPHAVNTPAIREGDVFRRVFERVVEACIAAGLVGGEGFAVDASLIQADATSSARWRVRIDVFIACEEVSRILPAFSAN